LFVDKRNFRSRTGLHESGCLCRARIPGQESENLLSGYILKTRNGVMELSVVESGDDSLNIDAG